MSIEHAKFKIWYTVLLKNGIEKSGDFTKTVTTTSKNLTVDNVSNLVDDLTRNHLYYLYSNIEGSIITGYVRIR